MLENQNKNQLPGNEIEKAMAAEGEIRGVVFVTDSQYVFKKEGQEGLQKVEETTKKMGYPIKFKEIKPFRWYPVGLYVVFLLAVKKALAWGDKEIFDMGNAAPKQSVVVKMILKYFVSLKKSVAEISNYWRKHFTIGKISCPEFHEEKKWLIIRMEDIKIHPILCILLSGYFLRIAQYVIKSSKISIKETKCMFRNDPYHDFLFTWE